MIYSFPQFPLPELRGVGVALYAKMIDTSPSERRTCWRGLLQRETWPGFLC